MVEARSATKRIQSDISDVFSHLEGLIPKSDNINKKNSHYWDNEGLHPDNSAIPSTTQTHFQLKRGKKNGVLDRIKNYHKPLAFTINTTKNSSGPFKPMNPPVALKIRFWNLSQIEFLAHESAEEIRNNTEFELWVGAYDSSSSIRETRDDIIEAYKSI
jgi:hypothetical protein